MAYTNTNYKTKKELKEAVDRYNYYNSLHVDDRVAYVHGIQADIRCYQPGLGPDLSNYTGKLCLEGPHCPKPHTWYAEAVLEAGKVISVK